MTSPSLTIWDAINILEQASPEDFENLTKSYLIFKEALQLGAEQIYKKKVEELQTDIPKPPSMKYETFYKKLTALQKAIKKNDKKYFDNVFKNGDLFEMKLLLQIKPEVVNERRLEYAIEYGHLDLLKLIDAQLPGKINTYYLVTAAQYGRLDILEFMKNKGMDLGIGHRTAIYQARKNNHPEVVNWYASLTPPFRFNEPIDPQDIWDVSDDENDILFDDYDE